MEYQVPQFIEVEDKIVGPLTLRQFIYLAGAGGLCVIFFFLLPLIFALILSVPVAALGAALAFYRVNSKPFIEVLESAFGYYTSSHLFLWKHQEPKAGAAAAPAPTTAPLPARGTPRLTRGKLSELSWSLDVKKPESLKP
ncbi:PrgI family protein [Candidatus Kaiserbacteria bacterium]|nr:PrgI family protein [Candidatus Kaiserbacteria bacterium]